MNRYRYGQLIVMIILFSLHVKAQESPAKPFLKVTGEVLRPQNFYAGDISKMNRVSSTVKDRDGKMQTYSGVDIQDILEKVGATMGKLLRGENLTKYLLVRCADGYEVVFSLAELDSSFTDRRIIIADQLDGKPLPAGRGPFRLIVPGEKKPARSSFQVTEFIIRFAKE